MVLDRLCLPDPPFSPLSALWLPAGLSHWAVLAGGGRDRTSLFLMDGGWAMAASPTRGSFQAVLSCRCSSPSKAVKCSLPTIAAPWVCPGALLHHCRFPLFMSTHLQILSFKILIHTSFEYVMCLLLGHWHKHLEVKTAIHNGNKSHKYLEMLLTKKYSHLKKKTKDPN